MTIPSIIPSGQSFSGDTGIANALGKNAAIVYSWMAFWVKYNFRNNKEISIHNEKSWVYHTYEKIAEDIEVLTEKEVRNGIDKLFEADIIIKSKFNKNKFDHTPWYTFSDFYYQLVFKNSKSSFEAPVGADRGACGGSSDLPVGADPHIDIKNIKEENISSLSLGLSKFFFEKLKEEVDPNMEKPNFEKWEKPMRIMLKNGRTEEEIKQAIEWVVKHESFWKGACQSPKSLRENFSKIQSQMKQPIYTKKADIVEINRKKAEDVKETVIKKIPEGKIIFEIYSGCVEIGYFDHPNRYYFNFSDLEFVSKFEEMIKKTKIRFKI